MDDAALLNATAVGDADAFACFYRRHLPAVLAYTVRMTGDRELATDLTAEVFAVALARCRRYDPRHPTALPWLLGIAGNKLRESRRRGRVDDAVRRRLQIDLPAPGREDLADAVALAHAGASEVLAVLDQLPAHERQAVQARFLADREYREMAADLQVSEAVARQRVSRGLARMRAVLSPTEESKESPE